MRPLDPRGSPAGRSTTADGERRTYDGVIVANGHLWDPFVPEYPGHFEGRVLHSGRYRNTGDLEGDRVLVVGAGQLGLRPRRRRRPGRPRDVRLGAPWARLPAQDAVRPAALGAAAARTPARTPAGAGHARADRRRRRRPERYGLPAPATRNLHRNRPVVNGQLLHFIHHGRVRVAPGIERLDGHDVYFTDGTVRAFDTIVYATGFKATVPFLDPALIESADGVPLRVAGMTLPVGARAPVLRRARRAARAAAPGLLGPGAADRQVPHRPGARASPLSRRSRPAARPEARIDIPRHEWQRDMDRTHRRIDRILRRAGGRGGPAGVARPRGAARMSGRLRARRR